MKHILLSFFFAVWAIAGFSQPVSPRLLSEAARQYMEPALPGCRPDAMVPLNGSGGLVTGYLFTFVPSGFLILSADRMLPPVYAMSFTGNYDLPDNIKRSLHQLIGYDLEARLQMAHRTNPDRRKAIAEQWNKMLDGRPGMDLPGQNPVQQWPEPGTTPTEGWLWTNWTQTAPYNQMCPMDLNAGSRSIAGCPAIAQAQIINYHEELYGTRFTDDDDYYHNYGQGNRFWIDDDWQTWDFPCFDTLNYWLDSLESVYAVNGNLSNPLKAALCFACGVAAHQVYSAGMSGTFGLEQAIMSFHRFGFEEAELIYPDDTTLNDQIAANMMTALPVQLGLLVSTGSGGHNVVVDGYNTDELYHFNFGWGGSANGWYTLPPENIPYNLTIIEGAILQIKSPQYTASGKEISEKGSVSLFPNPVRDLLHVDGIPGGAEISILDPAGRVIYHQCSGGSGIQIDCGSLRPGLYFLRITEGNRLVDLVKMIKE